MICGHHEGKWKDFLSLMVNWKVDDSLVSHSPAVLRVQELYLAIKKRRWSRQSTLPLHQAMRSCLASNDRDKLFAVRGLVVTQDQLDVRYDLTAEEVFEAFARKHILASQTLDILSYAQRTQIGCSWIPDWRVPAHRSIIAEQLALLPESDENFAPSAGGELRFLEFVDGSSSSPPGLRAEAIILGYLDTEGRPLDTPCRIRSRIRQSEKRWRANESRKPLQTIDWTRAAKAWRSTRSATAELPISKPEIHNGPGRKLSGTLDTSALQDIRSYFCALAMPTGPLPRRLQAEHRGKKWLRQISRHTTAILAKQYAGRVQKLIRGRAKATALGPTLLTSPDALQPTLQPTHHSYDRSNDMPSSSMLSAAYQRASEGRKMVRLAGFGDILVPDESRVGDVVCILLGARTPFVLRSRDKHYSVAASSNSEYQLIGDCYVEGVMQGEILRLAMDRENLLLSRTNGNVDFTIRDIVIV